ncbi:MAG: hypothetical protein ACLFPJ_02375 [Candidatus Woesearchaeota archaeon]
MLIKKLSMFFFLLGSLLALFGGSFYLDDQLKNFLILLIIFTGLFVGFFNISVKQQKSFLLSSVVFIISLLVFKIFLVDELFFLYNLKGILGNIILNFVFLISAAAFIVSFKIILKSASQTDLELNFTKKETVKKEKSFNYMWNQIVLISVAFIFIIFVLKSFFLEFLNNNFIILLNALDFFIWFIFLADLFFIYYKVGNFKLFLKTGWLDILATFPPIMVFETFFRFFKLFRAIKILRGIRILTKLPNPKVVKFFSKESGFNEYVNSDLTNSKRKTQKKNNKKSKR